MTSKSLFCYRSLCSRKKGNNIEYNSFDAKTTTQTTCYWWKAKFPNLSSNETDRMIRRLVVPSSFIIGHTMLIIKTQLKKDGWSTLTYLLVARVWKLSDWILRTLMTTPIWLMVFEHLINLVLLSRTFAIHKRSWIWWRQASCCYKQRYSWCYHKWVDKKRELGIILYHPFKKKRRIVNFNARSLSKMLLLA